jgi:tRNA(fMet)-specific endonuclease VapC
LLDTDVFSFFGKAGNKTAALYEKHVTCKTTALSFVTVGELLLWPKVRNWGSQKIAELQRRINLAQIIPYDMRLCETYADLKDKITKAGSPVPDNDLWIAATAVRQFGIPYRSLRTTAGILMTFRALYFSARPPKS